MSNKISGAEFPLSKIFSSVFEYEIPSYQRPYAWTVDQASELFDDLYDFYINKGLEDTYFLGSIVLIKEEGKPRAEVIDGQQRLSTLTILLALISSKESGSDFDKYIHEPGNELEDLKPKPRLTLRERDRDFFKMYVQERRFDDLLSMDSARLATDSQRNIQSNSRFFLKQFQTIFGDDSNKIWKFGKFLIQRCYLVVVSTPSQQSAFRIFSVLNSRGLNLLPTDIIKANVIGRVSQERRDDFTERWEEIEVRTGRDGFNDLFGHIRMIYSKVKAKRTLVEEFKEYVLNIFSPEDLIEKALEPYAEAYLISKKQQYVSTQKAEEVNRLLKWLNRIDNSDWLPPAILFLSKKKDEPEYVLWFFQNLERLAAYLHICAKNVNQRIERYAPVIESLQGEHSFKTSVKSMELTKEEMQEMKESLSGRVYDLTPRRRNYLILRLDSFLSDGAAIYDPDLLTVEHVLPQTVKVDSEWAKIWPDSEERNYWVNRIANLVPLTQRRNSQAQNFDFEKKKNAYFGGKHKISSYALTTQVLNENKWTPDIVQQRQKDLLNNLADGWKLNN